MCRVLFSYIQGERMCDMCRVLLTYVLGVPLRVGYCQYIFRVYRYDWGIVNIYSGFTDMCRVLLTYIQGLPICVGYC